MSVVPALTKSLKPYGLSFAIEDLAHIRRWAQSRQLTMRVAIDRLINGAEVEELVVLSAFDRRDQRVVLWRTFGTVYIQAMQSRPRGFTTVTLALEWLAPPPPAARKTFAARVTDYLRRTMTVS